MKKIKTYQLFEPDEHFVNEGFFNRDSTKSVESICNKYDIENWTLNPDGTVDVDGGVYLNSRGLTELPLKFGKVTGNFHCYMNKLTNLEGCPNWVGGNLFCFKNEITSLDGCPEYVDDNFDCSNNNLTSLIGGPRIVGGWFSCKFNKLTNLEGCPERISGYMDCSNNSIISLDYYPKFLEGKFHVNENPFYEIWYYFLLYSYFSSEMNKNHGHYLSLFDLNSPIRFEGGEWVCYMECLYNFFKEIGFNPSQIRLKNYKEV